MINIINNFFLVFILNIKSINKSCFPLFNNYFKFYNESIINQSIINETIINESIINETIINESIINETIINETIINETTNYYNEDDEIDFILFETLILPVE